MSNHWQNQQDLNAGALDLFLLLCEGGLSLKPKLNDILRRGAILGNPIFTQKEYKFGADYLIREFLFFSATIISPIDKQYNLISNKDRQAFENAKIDFEFVDISPIEIINKLRFIASVIEHILNSM